MTEALMKYGPHGAEVLAALMRAVFDPLIHRIYKHGGMIIGLAGDAFTAVFPDDEAGEDACWRGLAAAWQIQQHVAAHPIHATQYGDFPISTKVGLAAGEVSWGIVASGDGKRMVHYFRGPAVEICAECEHFAQPGEIIIDEQVYSRVSDRIEAVPIGSHFRVCNLVDTLPVGRHVDPPDPPPGLQERFFPAEVVRQSFSGEFRQVVSMFVNLPTVRTEAQLVIFMRSLFQLQDRYGGLLNRLDFGDKGSYMLLFWGAPVAFENDIERALSLILDLQEETSIPIKAGITYQVAHAGFIGSDLREEYTCYGQGTNLAARLMTAAPRGEIWVDAQIARRARIRFEIEAIGLRAFKGISQEQHVFQLLEPRQLEGGIYSGEFVGRQAEIARLESLIEPLSAGKFAGAVIIWGEAGIGKSRLVYSFRQSPVMESQSILWATCQADEIVRESFNPFRYWLRNRFEVSSTQVETRNKRNFNRILDQMIASAGDEALAAELDRTRSFLGALLDLYWPDSLYEQLDAEGRYENTLTALTTLFQVESLSQPLVIYLEDAHWLDQDSRSFLQRLIRSLSVDGGRSFPIAILATARPDVLIAFFGEGVDYEEIDLGRLSLEELARLAGAILEAPVDPTLVRLLADRSEGNPFFAEQILAYLKEREGLEFGASGWALRQGQQAPLPLDVNAVLVARLDRLVQEVKTIVQTASVLGQEFEIRLLLSMLAGESLGEYLAKAEQAGIWSTLDEFRRLFRHALLREAAYKMQVRARRQALHALAVEAIENLYASDLSPHYAELAFHAEQSGLVEKARIYLSLAGEAAQADFHNELAVDYLSRALDLTPREEIEARYQLLMAREQLYRLQGSHELRSRDLEALKVLIEASRPVASSLEFDRKQVQLAVRQANYFADKNDYPKTVEIAKEAALKAMQVNAPHLAVEAFMILCYGLQRMGETQSAVQQAETGLKIAREHGLPSGEGNLLNSLGLSYLEHGDYPLAHKMLETSLRLAQEIGDRQAEARPLLNLGNVAAGEGDYSGAREYYEQAQKIFQEIGQRGKLGLAQINLAWIAGILGDYAAARQAGIQVLRLASEVGDRHQQAFALINLSAWSSAQADFQDGQAFAQQSLDLNRNTSDRPAEAWSWTYLGHAYSGLGRTAEAYQAYQAALDLRQALGQPALACEPLAGLARLALAHGDFEAAQARVQVILAHLDGGGSLEGADEPLRVYLTCNQVLQAMNDPRSGALLERAYADLLESAAKIKDENARRSFLENVPVHREIQAAHAVR
jgi:predicted ATPase/class 3 adenylate cyclase